MSKRLSWYMGLTALLAAVTLGVQAQPFTGGLLGRGASYSGFVAPTGCADGLVPYFDASLKLVCSPTVYAVATDTTTSTGTIAARNLTATGLATPGSITVTPTLTRVGSITTIGGISITDGALMTVSDGTVEYIFEFEEIDGVAEGHIAISTVGDADGVRDEIISVWNGTAIKITASSGGAATVSLVADEPAIGGTITETVVNAGFVVSGMANPTAATTVTYQLVARLASGATTEAGAASSTAVSVATLTGTNFNRLSWSAVPGATDYTVYRTVAPTSPASTGVIYTGALLTFDDTGIAGGGETAPVVDNTGRLTADHASIADLSNHADNAAALAAGLVSGDLYRTATGVLMVVYTP